MNNYKTTISALVSVVASFILFYPSLVNDNKLIIQICKFTTLGGLASLGIQAKDK